MEYINAAASSSRIGHDRDLAYLLNNHKVDPDAKTTDNERPLIHHCVYATNPIPVIELLIMHGADVNIPNTNGVSPLANMLMARYTEELFYWPLVRLLLRHKAKFLLSDKINIGALKERLRRADKEHDLRDKLKEMINDISALI